MKKLWLTGMLALLVSGSALAADGPKEVEAALKQGNYALAEQDLRQAIAAHPQSAKAHYLLAQVLAHQGNIGDAQKEASQARQLDPKLGFTSPARFERFQNELNQALAPAGARATVSPRQELTPAAAPVEQRSSGSIWPWVFGAVIVVLLFGWLRRRQQGQVVNQGNAAPGTQNPYGNGPYPPNYPQSPGMGSGIGGSILGGIAGGVLGAAAVEAYENHERREEGERGNGQSGNAPAQSPQDQAYDNLRNAPVDTGNNDDSWGNGGDSSDGGGGDDSWS